MKKKKKNENTSWSYPKAEAHKNNGTKCFKFKLKKTISRPKWWGWNAERNQKDHNVIKDNCQEMKPSQKESQP